MVEQPLELVDIQGLTQYRLQRPPADARMVADKMLLISGVTVGLVTILTATMAFAHVEAIKEMIAFYSTIVALMSTLLGGMSAFYFARK